MKIGIDAGGTKTLGVLYDENANVLATVQSGMGNVLVDYDKAYSNIIFCINELLSVSLNKVNVIAVGGAGVSTLIDKLTEQLISYCHTHVIVKTDVQMSHIATFKNKDGMLLISGTGSVLLSCQNGEFKQYGGWGHLLGDEGSAYWLAKQMILVYKDYLENKPIPVGFDAYVPFLKEKLPTRQDVIHLVYRCSKDEVANLALLMTQLPDNAFTVYLQEQAAKHLAQLVLDTQVKEVTIAFEGSVLMKNKVIQELFLEQLKLHNINVTIVEKEIGTKAVLYL